MRGGWEWADAAGSRLADSRFTMGRFRFWSGAGVGIGSSPPPGIRLGTGVAGANSDKALASSGIFPAEQKRILVKAIERLYSLCLLYVCTISPLYSREKESIHFPIQPTRLLLSTHGILETEHLNSGFYKKLSFSNQSQLLLSINCKDFFFFNFSQTKGFVLVLFS